MTRPRWCLRFSLVAALLVVGVTAFQWQIIDVVTPFLMIPIMGAAWLFLLVCLIWAVVSLFVNRRKIGWRAAHPMLVCLAAFAIVLFVPFTNLWLEANWHFLRSARKEVVQRVQAGSLGSIDSERRTTVISLPPGSANVSTGGNDLLVEEHDGKVYVLFFTYRGILDNYSGYLFVPDGGDPRRFSDLNEAESTQLLRKEANWYYASHH